jgi:hypothetical protein
VRALLELLYSANKEVIFHAVGPEGDKVYCKAMARYMNHCSKGFRQHVHLFQEIAASLVDRVACSKEFFFNTAQ